MFAELIGPNGNKIYLAPDHVTAVYSAEKGSIICTVGGDTFVVQENDERVLRKLQVAKGK